MNEIYLVFPTRHHDRTTQVEYGRPFKIYLIEGVEVRKIPYTDYERDIFGNPLPGPVHEYTNYFPIKVPQNARRIIGENGTGLVSREITQREEDFLIKRLTRGILENRGSVRAKVTKEEVMKILSQ